MLKKMCSDARVQPAGAQHGPPRPIPNTGIGAAGAEGNHASRCRGRTAKNTAPPDDVLADGQRERAASRCTARAAVDDDGDEPEIVAERPQRGPKPHRPGIAPAAGVTLLVVDADERAARGAHHGPGRCRLNIPQSLSVNTCEPREPDDYDELRASPCPIRSPERCEHRFPRLHVKVLVTGGTGYLGRAIVRALLDRGHEPIVLARRAGRADVPCPAIDGDVRDHRRCGTPCVASMASIMRRRWSASGSGIRPTSIASTSAASRRCSTSARIEKTGRIVFTSSFLALPPAGATRRARGQRLSAVEGAGARGRACGRRCAGCRSSRSCRA